MYSLPARKAGPENYLAPEGNCFGRNERFMASAPLSVFDREIVVANSTDFSHCHLVGCHCSGFSEQLATRKMWGQVLLYRKNVGSGLAIWKNVGSKMWGQVLQYSIARRTLE